MKAQSVQELLQGIGRRQNRWQVWRDLSRCWAGAAALGGVFLLLRMFTGWSSPWAFWLLLAAAGLAAFAVWWGHRRSVWDVARVARMVEEENPRLHALLLTAAEQEPDSATGRFSYLQERLLAEALEHHRQRPWGHRTTERLVLSRCWHAVTLVAFLAVLPALHVPLPRVTSVFRFLAGGVEVTPGDTSVERGKSVVILARFLDRVPPEATLVVQPDGEPERRLPLVRNLADPVFGGSIPEVAGALTYRVEYGGQRTRDFQVAVFEYPRLERADARLRYPEYTRLPEKTIEDTRRVSAVEGTRLDFRFHLNKPVRTATLVGKDLPPVELAVETGSSNAYQATFDLVSSLKYDLVLVDEAGRTNRLPPQVVIDVTRNREPELKFVTPKGDQRVSPLEEVRFSGTAVDDFGLEAYGIAWNLDGGQTEVVELGQGSGPHEKRTMEHLLALESLQAQADQLVSYHLWADDIGPDGQRRRTVSDMYFAEVRPFEEIFREQQAMEGGGGGGGQGQGEQAEELAELQKQIISATWKLKREATGTKPSKSFADDTGVVRDSQERAVSMAGERLQQVEDPRSRALVESAVEKMEEALKHLTEAGGQPSVASLDPALSAEQAAYQALLRLAAREYRVSRGGQQQQGSGRNSRMQRQLDQLDLSQAENRYERQSQAQSPQDPAAREDLQVFNRLKELARRQQDLNEQVRELQTALQAADTQEEKEEIQRRLKRLREEQEEMLADVDELNQRMNRSENQNRMAESRQQLEQARSEARRAAQSLESGDASQALSAGTRAERELSTLRDDFRRETASQFSEAMRGLRDEARELARKEEEIGRNLEALDQDQRKTLSTSEERTELASALEQQGAKRNQLVERATAVTQEAESVEPRLARQLYDTLRQASQEDPKNLQETADALLNQGKLLRGVYETLEAGREGSRPSVAVSAELLRRGYTAESSQLEQRARRSLNQLKEGVERAAESILGDDTEALRFARRELDDLTRQLNGERGTPERGEGEAGEATDREGTDPGQPGERTPGRQPAGEQVASERPGEGRGGAEERRQGATGRERREGREAELARAGGQQGGEQGEGSGREPGGQPGQQGARQLGQQGQGGSEGERGGPEGQAQAGDRTASRNGGAEGGDTWGGGTGGWRGPILGADYQRWSDRLREVEEALDQPTLREDAARIRDEARRMRIEFRRHGREPQWDLVEAGVFKPLVELRSKVAEELARRESKDSLVPVDRDPVPGRYTELVRRYYEQLGKSP